MKISDFYCIILDIEIELNYEFCQKNYKQMFKTNNLFISLLSNFIIPEGVRYTL